MFSGEGLTVINLLQRHLSIVWQSLLSFGAEHESFWFLWSGHGCMLRIHHAVKLLRMVEVDSLFRLLGSIEAIDDFQDSDGEKPKGNVLNSGRRFVSRR